MKLSDIDSNRILEIIEPSKPDVEDKAGWVYDTVMIVAIVCSLIPLATHSKSWIFNVMDIVTCVIFIIDYLIRWSLSGITIKKKGVLPYLLYPITPMAVIDLLSILPTLSLISPAFKVLRFSRLFKIVRIFRFVRYYEPLQILLSAMKRERKTLASVLLCAVFYILICALVMYNVENDPSFSTFFDALYWACCTLTTVGYGDIYPVSVVGRAFSMISAIVGIALIALPSSIITSGYIEELKSRRKE